MTVQTTVIDYEYITLQYKTQEMDYTHGYLLYVNFQFVVLMQ